MAAFGSDLQKFTTPWLYVPRSPGGLWLGLAFAFVLIIVNGLLQFVFGVSVLALIFKVGIGDFLSGTSSDQRELIKAFLIGILPASILTAVVAWYLAKVKGGVPREVLALRWPDLGWLGWVCIIGGFLVAMYAMVFVIVTVFQIDLAQYTPGPDGQSPSTGSAGMVKEAMFDLANEPVLFWLAFPAIAIGAPLAEEFVFRGQLFAALANSRAGLSGATIITSALWSLMHITEPWLAVGIIFLMGLVLGALLIRFGSLWVTMACHAIWNGAYAAIIFWAQPQ